MSHWCINGNLKAGFVLLLLGTALGVSGCKEDPTLFGGCSTQDMNACPQSEGFANPYEGQLELLSWTETLRKASLELTGRLPTERQRQITEEFGQSGLEASLAEMMRDQRFYDRMIELYNDHFLTDKYLGRENAIELLDEEEWPNLRWYEGKYPGDEQKAQVTNDSLAREPLELIAHVIAKERPFTEILTANYTMANGYSQLSLVGLPDIPLGIGENPESFREISVPGIPHAGILTSAMFLNRFPTSDTNINRHRSRMTYLFFLDIDINQFGSRPVDASNDFGENPTLNNPDCTVCHTTMDPVAGLYMNWNERGEYSGEGDWFGPDYILPPGFNGEALPDGDRRTALQWFAQRLAQNPRFAQATVKMVFEGLTGQEILDITVPMTPDMAEEAMQEPDPMMDPEPDPMMDAGVGGMGGMAGMGGIAGMGGTAGMGGMAGEGGMGGMGGTTPPPLLHHCPRSILRLTPTSTRLSSVPTTCSSKPCERSSDASARTGTTSSSWCWRLSSARTSGPRTRARSAARWKPSSPPSAPRGCSRQSTCRARSRRPRVSAGGPVRIAPTICLASTASSMAASTRTW